MSRKKRLRNEASKPAATTAAAAKPAAQQKKPPDLSMARRLAFLAYALCGLGIGLITGFNHLPEPPRQLVSLVSQAAFAGDVLGSQPISTSAAMQSGALGLAVGGSLGFALSLEPMRLLGGLLVGALGLASGLSIGLGMLPAAAGWLIGFLVAVKGFPTQPPS